MKQNFSNISEIDYVIYLSKVIIALKILKLHILVELKLISRTRVKLNTTEYISSQLEEIDLKLLNIHNYIQNLLKPYFNGKEFGYDQIETWGFTANDMRKGYLALNEIDKDGNYLGNDHDIEYKYILFLNNYIDKRFKIKQGDLLPFKEVTSILGNQNNLFIGELDLTEYTTTVLRLKTKNINLKV